MSSISKMIGRSWVSCACPSCGIENDCQVQQFTLGERILCRGCHEPIRLVDTDASTATAQRQLGYALDELQETLKFKL